MNIYNHRLGKSGYTGLEDKLVVNFYNFLISFLLKYTYTLTSLLLSDYLVLIEHRKKQGCPLKKLTDLSYGC